MKDVIRFRDFLINALTDDSLEGWSADADSFHRGWHELRYRDILLIRCGQDAVSCFVHEPVSETDYRLFTSKDIDSPSRFKIFKKDEIEALLKLINFKLRSVLESKDLEEKTENIGLLFKLMDAISDKYVSKTIEIIK